MIALLGDLGFDIRRAGKKKLSFLGGSGFHALAGALIANGNPILVSYVGSDFDLSRITRYHVPTRFIRKDKRRRTSQFIIEGTENARSVRFNNWPFPVMRGVVSSKEILGCNIIHLTSAIPTNQLIYINNLKKNRYSGLISVDVFDQHCIAFPEEVLKVLSLSDIVFMNQNEQQLLNYIEDLTNQLVIIKHGRAGAVCSFNKIKLSSYFPVDAVVDTVGAGDVLCGAFLSAIDNGLSANDSLDLAVKIASKSVEFFGNESYLQEFYLC